MASIAHPPASVPSTISDAVVLEEERRPQAGPLPRKRGEFGYRESIDGGNGQDNTGGDSAAPLPPRHPADRDIEPPPPGESNTQNPGPPSGTASTTAPTPNTATSTIADASSTRKSSKSNTFLSRFDLRPVLKKKKFGGVALGTILRLVFQIISLAGTIALWVVVTRVLAVAPSNDGPATGTESPGAPPKSGQVLGSSGTIFLHVSFGIVSLVQVLFLERCIFFVRAQRYAHTHHDASLPMHSHSGSGNSSSGAATNLSMSLAPWNRPPLPTYAAALSQCGVGTGDVEDNLIAIPPPPAYGHTRDSTLLLAGFMPSNIRRPPSQYSSRSWPISLTSRPSRPVSYRSHDEEWEQRCDAERALRLAETLDRLENAAQSSTTSTTSEQAPR